MGSVLQMMQDAIVNTLESFWAWLQTLGPNPLEWPASLWLTLSVMLVLIIIVLVTRKDQATPEAPKARDLQPDLLISKGEVIQLENSVMQQLNLKVSNLGTQPVQLLEFTLKTDLMPAPVTVEAVELIGPVDSIELEAILPTEVIGEKGELEAFFYTAKQPKRIYALSAQLSWEPWHERFKISPLGQKRKPTRTLASERLSQLRRKAWEERHPKVSPAENTPPDEPLEPEFPDRIKDERRKLDWDFPKEF
jgi:hypothetical protein